MYIRFLANLQTYAVGSKVIATTCEDVKLSMQSYIKEDSKIRNGIFLGQIAGIEFQGPYEYNKVQDTHSFLQSQYKMMLVFLNVALTAWPWMQNKLTFDFNLIRLRLGPKWFDFKINTMKKET